MTHRIEPIEKNLEDTYPVLDCKTCPVRFGGDLSGLSDTLLSQACDSLVVKTYKKGQTIYSEGSWPFGVYCVYSGVIKLYKRAFDNQEYILYLVRTGELLGYNAIFTNENYSATAEVLEEATLCFFNRETFLNILTQDTNLIINLLSKYGNKIRNLEEKARDLAYNSAMYRIVELLLMLIKTDAVFRENGSCTLNIDLSLKNVANMAGTSIETASRIFTYLTKSKMIKRTNNRYKHIIILDPEALVLMKSKH